MNVRESINRGFNLLAVSIVGLSGFAFLPEVFLEKDFPDKIDDGLLFIVGILGILWYNRGGNRYARSKLPIVLVAVSLIVKIVGIMIEFNDAESVGDDFGALILFVLSVALILHQYFKTKKLLVDAH